MNDAPAPRPGPSHAPEQAHTLLFPLAIASAVLGVLLLVGRLSLGAGDIVTDSELRRSWFLLGLGGYLLFQAAALLLIHLARSDDLAAAAPAALTARFREAGLGGRLLLVPRLVLAQRRVRLFLHVALMIVLATALLLLTNYVFARHNLWRIDLTEQALYSLSEESVALAETLQDDVRLVLLLPSGGEQTWVRQVEALADQYRTHSSHVRVERLDPLVLAPGELARKRAELHLPDRSPSLLSGVVVQSGLPQPDGTWRVDQSKHITRQEFFDRDGGGDEHGHGGGPGRRVFRGEQQLSAAIQEVTGGERTTLYFLTGHEEASIGDFERGGLAELARALRDRNVQIKTLLLSERERRDVPEDCDVLVIAAPRAPLTEADVAAIELYLDGGGDALVLLEAEFRLDGERTEWLPTGLEKLLETKYGVRTEDRRILFTQYSPLIQREVRRPELELTSFHESHPVTRPLVGRGRSVFAATARPLVKIPVLGVQITKLLETRPELGGRISATRDMAHQVQTGYEPGPFVLALASERTITPVGEAARAGEETRTSRLVAVGDRDWLSNQVLSSAACVNLELALNAINWCQEREAHLVGKAPRQRSHRLEMSQTELLRFQLVAFFGLPSLALALGILAWVLRYRS